MKFSENWLCEWVNLLLLVYVLFEQLSMVGFEVDGVEFVVGEFLGVLVGEVVECGQYFNVDKFCVIKINVGGDELLDIVCGVFNCCLGIKVVVVCVGVVLSGNFKIKKVKLCGEFLFGMLCSFFELGISDDYDGIIELLVDVLIGEDICEYFGLNDNIIEVDFIFNCVDCLGICGFVCEVGVLNNLDVCEFVVEVVSVMIDDMLKIMLSVDDVCLCYLGCVVKGVNVNVVLLLWFVEKLCCCGICSIDFIVDVINFVFFEFGQLMYVFNLVSIEGNINVCLVNEGEIFMLFDEIEVKLESNILVIVDDNKVLVMVGIFGGFYLGVIIEI